MGNGVVYESVDLAKLHPDEEPGGESLDLNEDKLALSVLAMTTGDVDGFVKASVRSRKLTPIVRQLNREALSKREPAAGNARKALRKLGFAE